MKCNGSLISKECHFKLNTCFQEQLLCAYGSSTFEIVRSLVCIHHVFAKSFASDAFSPHYASRSRKTASSSYF